MVLLCDFTLLMVARDSLEWGRVMLIIEVLGWGIQRLVEFGIGVFSNTLYTIQGKSAFDNLLKIEDHETHYNQRYSSRALYFCFNCIACLAGEKNIRRETREKVIEMAEKLGYKPNPVATNLKFGHSNTVGIIVPEMVTPFAS